jgi:hypothetical protein
MFQCLMATLLVVAFSAAAFGAEAAAAPALTTTVDSAQWGHNVLITSLLTKGQSIGFLFGNTILKDVVGDANTVNTWFYNFKTAPASADKPKTRLVRHALEMLLHIVTPGNLDYDVNIAHWTLYDIQTKQWDALSGNADTKVTVRAAFKLLRDSGVMCLPFLNRKDKEDLTPGQSYCINTIHAGTYAHVNALTHEDLYTKTAGDATLTPEEIDFLSYAMDGAQVIRTESPEPVASRVTGCCCNRTTNACVTGGGNCNMSGGKCQLGSTWCP